MNGEKPEEERLERSKMRDHIRLGLEMQHFPARARSHVIRKKQENEKQSVLIAIAGCQKKGI